MVIDCIQMSDVCTEQSLAFGVSAGLVWSRLVSSSNGRMDSSLIGSMPAAATARHHQCRPLP